MPRQPARENLEIRVLSTGKGWRVDACEVGALTTRRISGHTARQGAILTAQRLAAAMRNLDYYGYVRVMIEAEKES